MTDFTADMNIADPVPPVHIAQLPEPVPETKVRLVPVEDLGMGVVRLIKGGVVSVAALGQGDTLSVAVKKTTTDIVGVANQVKQKVSQLVNRCQSAKE